MHNSDGLLRFRGSVLLNNRRNNLKITYGERDYSIFAAY
jgi:hypothetical protein